MVLIALCSTAHALVTVESVVMCFCGAFLCLLLVEPVNGNFRDHSDSISCI